MEAFFTKLWEGLKWLCRKLFSPILDREWDLDPYKIGGFVCFGVAIKLALATVAVIASADTEKLITLSGLASAFITAGTFMFGHSKNSDNTLGSNLSEPK